MPVEQADPGLGSELARPIQPGRFGRGKAQTWIGFLISLFFLILIVRKIDSTAMVAAFRDARYWPVLPAVAIYLVGVLIRAVRWQLLLKPLARVNLADSFRIIAIGYMANNIFPLRAGEFYRAHLLGTKATVSRTAVFSTIVLERLFDGLAMLFFLTILFTRPSFPIPPALSTVTAFSAFFFGGLLLASLGFVFFPTLVLGLSEMFLRLLPARLSDPLHLMVQGALAGLQSLRGWVSVTSIMLLSIVAWVCESLMYLFLFWSFSLPVGFGGGLLLVAIVNLGIMIPSSPGYVGTFEYFCTQTLTVFAVNPTLAFSYAAFLHVALFLPITLLGWLFWAVDRRKF